MTASETSAYLRTKVNTANPVELRLMLFDGAIKFAENARRGLQESDYETSYNGISRCQAILMELINSLCPDQDPDLCKKLSALYTFMYTRLIAASSDRDPAIVGEVLELLRYERETWSMLIEKLAQDQMGDAIEDSTASNNSAGSESSVQQVDGLIGGRVSVEG